MAQHAGVVIPIRSGIERGSTAPQEIHYQSVYGAVLGPKEIAILVYVLRTLNQEERANFGIIIERQNIRWLCEKRDQFIEGGLGLGRINITEEELEELVETVRTFQQQEDAVLDANGHITAAQIVLGFLSGTDEEFLNYLQSDQIRELLRVNS